MVFPARAWSPVALGVGLVIAASPVGCSLLTSLDGLTGGSSDGPDGASPEGSTVGPVSAPDGGVLSSLASDGATGAASDAQTGPSPGSGSDGSGGSPPNDSGGAPQDTGVLPPPVEAGSVVVFADSFDTSQALPRGWSFLTNADGALSLDSTNSVSPPASLRVTANALPAGAPGNAANITLRQPFAMPAAQATVDYDFKAFVSQFDQQNSANAVVGALQIGDAAGDLYELQVDLTPAGAGSFSVIFAEYAGFADAASSYVAHPVSTTFPVGAWTPVTIELTASSPPVARLFFNGNLVVETTINVPFQGSFIQICLGVSYLSAPSQAWTVNYDDTDYRAP